MSGTTGGPDRPPRLMRHSHTVLKQLVPQSECKYAKASYCVSGSCLHKSKQGRGPEPVTSGADGGQGRNNFHVSQLAPRTRARWSTNGSQPVPVQSVHSGTCARDCQSAYCIRHTARRCYDRVESSGRRGDTKSSLSTLIRPNSKRNSCRGLHSKPESRE